MTINIIQKITKVLTEDKEVISTVQSEGYTLAPDTGKMLLNKLTGETFRHKIYLYQKSAIGEYEEIDIPLPPKKPEEE